MNVYLRNGIIAVIINMVIFIIGWGCIVPDQLVDNTHIFGLVGSVELVKGNTAVVFGMCASLSTLSLIISLVEALVEDYSRPCRFNPVARSERPKKTPKVSGMRIDPSPDGDPKTPEKCTDEDKDPKTPVTLLLSGGVLYFLYGSA